MEIEREREREGGEEVGHREKTREKGEMRRNTPLGRVFKFRWKTGEIA